MLRFQWGWFLFSLKGRVRLFDYWVRFNLPFVAISIALTVAEKQGFDVAMVGKIFGVLTLWPAIAITAKRAHDRNHSIWWMIGMYVGGIGCASLGIYMDGGLGIVVVLVGLGMFVWLSIELNFVSGTLGANDYGPDPWDALEEHLPDAQFSGTGAADTTAAAGNQELVK